MLDDALDASVMTCRASVAYESVAKQVCLQPAALPGVGCHCYEAILSRRHGKVLLHAAFALRR